MTVGASLTAVEGGESSSAQHLRRLHKTVALACPGGTGCVACPVGGTHPPSHTNRHTRQLIRSAVVESAVAASVAAESIGSCYCDRRDRDRHHSNTTNTAPIAVRSERFESKWLNRSNCYYRPDHRVHCFHPGSSRCFHPDRDRRVRYRSRSNRRDRDLTSSE